MTFYGHFDSSFIRLLATTMLSGKKLAHALLPTKKSAIAKPQVKTIDGVEQSKDFVEIDMTFYGHFDSSFIRLLATSMLSGKKLAQALASKLCNLLLKAVWNAPALGGSSCIIYPYCLQLNRGMLTRRGLD
ncbi:hypothetical protein ZIOFF_075267 [Zingiber officinale]|uniref:Uncharacterized protein n=1 Tax=Zingiber officinale TaxID=94328 RepID=A0A8J5ERL4_ZINOF|nr:hypothetical protein ZIOFF_075267 [Zingiber officinale]